MKNFQLAVARIYLVAAAMTVTVVTSGAQATTLIGPSPYLSTADSPFSAVSGFTYFHLEDFEDGAFNTPGVTETGGVFIVPPGTNTDSVDGDDGSVDGSGQNGRSQFANGNAGITFTFDSIVLGALPTHAGIVFTDGNLDTRDVLFEAFDEFNASLGTIGPIPLGDFSFEGGTAEDRFFGIISDVGIGSIRISQPGSSSGFEVDHLQFGFLAIPEPGTFVAFAFGVLSLALSRRRRIE